MTPTEPRAEGAGCAEIYELERIRVRYRISGWINYAIWNALPLPNALQTWLSCRLHHLPPMTEARVLGIVDCLDAAGVSAWLSGGWGVSALAGRQLRQHSDLDLVIDRGDEARAVEALKDLGYKEGHRVDSEVPLFARVVLRDDQVVFHEVDLHPVDLAAAQLEFTTGQISGRPVACLSAHVQLTSHAGYRRRLRDRLDIRVLRRLVRATPTTLIIPVPEAEHLISGSADDRGMPAHITVLYPFLDSDNISDEAECKLAEIAAATPSFVFTFLKTGRFPGVVYLAPEPSAPFEALTNLIVEHWPSHPPYGGQFGAPVPHLTVARGDEPQPAVTNRLPVAARAQELWLMEREMRRWVPRRRFPLGGV